jgi:hypothetical protein
LDICEPQRGDLPHPACAGHPGRKKPSIRPASDHPALTMVDDHGILGERGSHLESMAISEFKATCLAVLERVRRTKSRC